jgi:hypothetical protein
MQNPTVAGKMTLLGVLLFVALSVPMSGLAQQTLLNRLAAEFRHFDGTVSFTGAGIPGILVWTKSVFVPSSPVDQNTIYVTISTTGIAQPQAAALFQCLVDGQPCNAGFGGLTGGPAGWVNLQRQSAVLADNGIHYTWCMKIQPGTHTVQVRMASSAPPAVVAIETAHFYIDSNKISLGATTGCSVGAQ